MHSDTEELVRLGREVFTIEMEGIAAVRDRLDQRFSHAVAMLAACSGRVIVAGLGKSGLVGRKIAATLSSTGTPSFFLHPVEGAHGDLGAIRHGDMVIAISNSGRTEELNAIIPALRALGAGIIAITGDASSPLAQMADQVLDVHVPKEACPMNLAPTASTTATLAMGDALAVCLLQCKAFTPEDFHKFHPGGALGQRLRLKVSSVMHTGTLPVAPVTNTVEDTLHVVDAGGLGAALLVDEQGVLQGILTDGDIRRALKQGALTLSAPVSDIMTPNPRCAREDQSVAELLDLMESAAITVLPVADAKGTLKGIIHLHDLLGKGKIRFS